MRERVNARFNIDFDGANPFHSLLVAESEARIAPETEQSVVRCFGGCGKFFDGLQIVNRRFTPYNKCTNCAFEIFEDQGDYDRKRDYGRKYLKNFSFVGSLMYVLGTCYVRNSICNIGLVMEKKRDSFIEK